MNSSPNAGVTKGVNLVVEPVLFVVVFVHTPVLVFGCMASGIR